MPYVRRKIALNGVYNASIVLFLSRSAYWLLYTGARGKKLCFFFRSPPKCSNNAVKHAININMKNVQQITERGLFLERSLALAIS